VGVVINAEVVDIEALTLFASAVPAGTVGDTLGAVDKETLGKKGFVVTGGVAGGTVDLSAGAREGVPNSFDTPVVTGGVVVASAKGIAAEETGSTTSEMTVAVEVAPSEFLPDSISITESRVFAGGVVTTCESGVSIEDEIPVLVLDFTPGDETLATETVDEEPVSEDVVLVLDAVPDNEMAALDPDSEDKVPALEPVSQDFLDPDPEDETLALELDESEEKRLD
jgi:hypothetical protein